MGDVFGVGRDEEYPVTEICLRAFNIGRYEVPQGLWRAVMGRNPARLQGAERPVENVSWLQVHTFIRRLNERTGHKYRLPTEAEWEYAARAGGRRLEFATAGGGIDHQRARYYRKTKLRGYPKPGELRVEGHAPVGHYPPNALGLYDMSGNVWEWVEDCWHRSLRGIPRSGRAWSYPCDGSTDWKVIRGGDWSSRERDLRTTRRRWADQRKRNAYIGFRLVRVR